MHFHARGGKVPFMYIFAEPVTEEGADEIQNAKQLAQKAFARDIVGIDRNDPEIQKEWHDIQDSVDTEVDEDENRGQVEEAEDLKEPEVDEAEDNDITLVEDEDAAEDVIEDTAEDTADAAERTEIAEDDTEENMAELVHDGPLIGWTLAVRSRVNGVYVERPEMLTSEDNWTVEYHIKEIAPDARWNLYNKVKEDRRKLIGRAEDEQNSSLENYRGMIRNFSNRGRRWREQQDKVDDQNETQIFRPLGPGSQAEENINA
jgi:hypothetical protein